MTPGGHVARALAAGLVANRTLVRDVVSALLRSPGQPCYVVYDGHRLTVRASRPVIGVWAQVGPYEPYVPVDTLAREVEFVAVECRQRAETMRC